MAFPVPPVPKSLLGRHRLLAPTAAIKVSPICLGAMSFGDAWKEMMGECGKDNTFAMLDQFYQQGGNFIDTAVNYQFGDSEQFIGEWMEARGVRDEMIIATKFTGSQTTQLKDKVIQSNFSGNSAKNIHTSVRKSLKALKTDYIDVYYLHVWDSTTSIPEFMHALNDLCVSGKVLYLGISDTPAWIVVKANCYAREHGLRQFSVYQGRWGAACRDFERDIIPMCISEGMALAPWGVLAGGGFNERTTESRPTTIGRTGKEDKVRLTLEKVAKDKGTLPTSVALAYVLHKAPYVFPIIGGRKTSHLASNIEALGLELSAEDMAVIDGAYDFELGFPHDFLAGGQKMILGPEDNSITKRGGYFDHVKPPQPIKPHQGALDQLHGFTPLGHGVKGGQEKKK